MSSRICIIASFTRSLINFRGHLLGHFVDQGHEVHALSPDPDASTLQQLADRGIRHHDFPMQRMGMNPAADLRTFLALKEALVTLRPDHLLSYTIKPVIYGSLAASRARIPSNHALITGLGTAFQGSGFTRTILNKTVEQMYRP